MLTKSYRLFNYYNRKYVYNQFNAKITSNQQITRCCTCDCFIKGKLLKKDEDQAFNIFNLFQKCHQRNTFIRNYCTKAKNEDNIKQVDIKPDISADDLRHIMTIFSDPISSLNILKQRLSQNAFDIYYKHNNSTAKKKIKQILEIGATDGQMEWHCTYNMRWPLNTQIQCSASTKKSAAKKAAATVLSWLYKSRRISKDGQPLESRETMQNMMKDLNLPIRCTIMDEDKRNLDSLLHVYDREIGQILNDAHEEFGKRWRQSELLARERSELMSQDKDLSGYSAGMHPVYGRHIPLAKAKDLKNKDEQLVKMLEQYRQYIAEELPLPIDDYGSKLEEAIYDNRVTIIVGAPGCGKSTRAPVLGALKPLGVQCRALVAQPRKVAAITLAESVAQELGEEVGQTIGYQVRLQSQLPSPPGGSILYCTSGVLLGRLKNNPGLFGCSHVFLDEAHERDVNTDIILLLLKRALNINEELKVVIMSATLDTQVFTGYFENCPVVQVPGKAYPVETYYLEDLEQQLGIGELSTALQASQKEHSKPTISVQEVVRVIRAIDSREPEGAILVFLPGWSEIKAIKDNLEQELGRSPTHYVLPVHSKLSMSDQKKIFSRAPAGVRKIVLATNIAETSITVRDVVYVLDCGAHKEYQLNEGTGMCSLDVRWVSAASAGQRRGRAGRVQPGKCYRLYTRERHNAFQSHTLPEILRVPLEKTVLDCKSYSRWDLAKDFLSQLPEPPKESAIRHAVQDLRNIGALTEEESLTALGRRMTNFTMHPRLAKSLLLSVCAGNLSAQLNVITQLCSGTEPFASPQERRDEIRSIKSSFHPWSDHAALHWLHTEYEELADSESDGRQFCTKYGLRRDRMTGFINLKRLHLDQLSQSGIMPKNRSLEKMSQHSVQDELTKSILLAGVGTLLQTRQLLKAKGKRGRTKEIIPCGSEGRAFIGSDSVNHKIQSRRPGARSDLLVYFGGVHSAERRGLVVHEASLVTPHALLLFCDSPVTVKEVIKHNDEDWKILEFAGKKLTIHLPSEEADLLLHLRVAIWKTFEFYMEHGDVATNRHLPSAAVHKVEEFREKMLEMVASMLNKAEHVTLDGNTDSATDDTDHVCSMECRERRTITTQYGGNLKNGPAVRSK